MDLYFQRRQYGNNTRLILKVDGSIELDQFALNMMRYNRLEYIVPVQSVQYNDSRYLQFDVSKMDLLNSRINQALKKAEVVSILSNIIAAVEEADSYMLSESSLYLDMDYIFLDDTNNCKIIYIPISGASFGNTVDFLREVVQRIKPDYSEKDTYIYDIINAFSRGVVRTISDLKELLYMSSVNAKASVMSNIADKSIEQPESGRSEIAKPFVEKQEIRHDNPMTKSNSIPVNIPSRSKLDNLQKEKEKEPARKADISFSIPGKAQENKNVKAAINGKSEEIGVKNESKKHLGFGLFRKKNTDVKDKKEEKAKIKTTSLETPIISQKNLNLYNNNNIDKGMYESYEKTVFYSEPEIEDNSNDANATEYLDMPEFSAKLLRRALEETIYITKNNAVVGSGGNADCFIGGNKAVSRQHAIIILKGGAYYIRDNNSSNGTWVNGNRITPGREVLLQNNALVKLADEEFIFKE